MTPQDRRAAPGPGIDWDALPHGGDLFGEMHLSETLAAPAPEEPEPVLEDEETSGGGWKIAIGLIAALILAAALTAYLRRPRDLKKDLLRR